MKKIFLDKVIITNSDNKKNYPFNMPIYKNGLNLKFNKPITFITGENGSGKSTFLENLAVEIGFNLLGGNKNHSYYNNKIQDNNELSNYMKLYWNLKTNDGFFFRAESFFNFVNYVDELAKENGAFIYNSYGGKSLQKQSHGESFLALFQNRFNKGLFILDEPEAALSPEKQLSLVGILNDLASSGQCQFIVATHSPILIACPNSELYEIENDKFVRKDYKQSKQFEFYKNFLNMPDRYIKYLIEH